MLEPEVKRKFLFAIGQTKATCTQQQLFPFFSLTLQDIVYWRREEEEIQQEAVQSERRSRRAFLLQSSFTNEMLSFGSGVCGVLLGCPIRLWLFWLWRSLLQL
jgi:hypothetical protein